MLKTRDHQNLALTAISETIKGIINYPTGTGKSLIQSRSIVDNIKLDNSNKVYVILSPRILLSRQLLNDVHTDLVHNNIDAQYLIVNSGGTTDESEKWYKEAKKSGAIYIHRDINSTTSRFKIQEEYDKSVLENVPLIISGTYHSAKRIMESGIPVEVYHCDEAHYLVSDEFKNIVEYPSNKKYFYTATMKVTSSDDGLGMNNYDRFGEIIAQKSPLEMIEAGEIIRPRMHFVDLSLHNLSGSEIDGKVIVESFKEHVSLVSANLMGLGAKLLVTANGSEELNKLVNHDELIRLKENSLNLTIFDISSEYQPRINGEVKNRKEFLDRLQALEPEENAIIIHINILTEGIDVPGITGILPMVNLKKSKFLQTLGRSTRLFPKDRIKLYTESMMPNELEHFFKPYAWVIVPVYGDYGDDLRENLYGMIEELRSFGFDPSQDCVVKERSGKQIPVQIDLTSEPTKKTQSMLGLIDMTASVIHDIETKEKADKLEKELFNIEHLSEEELFKLYLK